MILKYLKLPFYFDVKSLQEEVAVLEKRDWKLHYQTLHYEGEWTALPLRSVGGKSDDVIISAIPDSNYHDTVFLQESPYLQEILSTFKCPLMAVRLLKLNAGAVIKEHRDMDLCFEKGEIRLHIPVRTHEDVEFYLDQERILAREGECWYMNFNLPHSIRNNSPVNRVHLVIDAVVNDWVRSLFSEPVATKKMIPEAVLSEDVSNQIIAQLRQMKTETSNRMADEMEAGPAQGK